MGCDPAPCVAVCPTGSFSQRPGGGVKVKPELCINCGDCAKACPVDAILMEPETNIPFVCLHCGRCVKFCPQNCLEMVDLPGEPQAEPLSPSQPEEAPHA